MLSLSFSRKGQIQNYLVVIVFLFVMGFINILAFYLHSQFIDAFTAAGIYTGVIAETGAKFASALQLYDWVILLIMIALIISVALTSFRLSTSPAFFIITIFMAVFLGAISYFFNYMFQQLVSQPFFAATLLFFPRTILIGTNLHWIGLVALVVGSITLYAKKDSSQNVVTPPRGGGF